MTLNFKHTIIVFSIIILTIGVSTDAFACTCIGKDKQTTESELNFSDLAVKGRIIAMTEYKYYDTAELSLAKIPFDEKKWSYLIRKYKVFTLVIDNMFKATKPLSDTIQILTGFGGGDCGYEFELGKDYIVYGEAWKEKTVTIRHKKRRDKLKVIETTVANRFYTDICKLTQEANTKELDNLKRLTE